MDRRNSTRLVATLRIATVAGIVSCIGATVSTSDAASGPVVLRQDADQARMVDDFLHYVLIAKPDLAEATGRSLFDSGITDAQLADVVRSEGLGEKVERALSRGRGMAGVGPMVTRFEDALEQGRLDLARDQDRIADAIKMLNGSLRSQLMARRRLVEAGEYAVPALLEELITTKSPDMELRVTEVLEEIKRQAVLPLVAALPDLSPVVQAKVCRILSNIGWPTAIPFLLELGTSSKATPDVKDAAMTAFRRLGGTSTDVSAAFTALGTKFFEEEQSLVAYPSDPMNMVWSYGPHSGLAPVPVPTSIYAQVMSMRCTRTALAADSTNRRALATYVAADLRRENQLAAGETDPFAADATYSPQFFATAAGSTIGRDVLAMALDANDTALIRDAIAAMGQTVGRGNMFPAAGRAPLLECLRYPDRRVQYDAALVLGDAMPARAFSGDNLVVPLLASAVRSGGDSYAVVAAPTDEDRTRLAGMLTSSGFKIVAAGEAFYDLEPEISKAAGVDLVLIDGAPDKVIEMVGQVRSFDRTGATPVLVVTDAVEGIKLDREFAQDRATMTWNGGGTDDQFNAAVDHLLEIAAGGRLSDADAFLYTQNALQTLATIARANGTVFDIAAAQPALLEAMGVFQGQLRLMVADVVALIGSPECQRALADAALSSSDADDRIYLLGAAAANAQLYGNRMDTNQIAALRTLISDNASATGNADVADAAGRLYGALDLPTDEAVRLITR